MLLNRCRGNLRQMAVCEVVGICHVMKRLVALSAIALTSQLSANCDVYDSYESAMNDNLLIKRECEFLLGGGGTYHADLIEAKESAQVSSSTFPSKI